MIDLDTKGSAPPPGQVKDMTVLQHFACAAMAAIISGRHPDAPMPEADIVARAALQYAHALIALVPSTASHGQ